MRKLSWATVLLAVAVISIFAQEADTDAARRDREHTQWIDHVMASISTIKPGMTRKDLSRVFGEEGGLSTPSHRRYIYKHCPHIKVDIDFSSEDGSLEENPDDKIVQISRPFLEYSIMD